MMEKNREQNINNIISVVKLVSLLFCATIVYKSFFLQNKSTIEYKLGYYNDRMFGIFICVTVLIYWLWSLFSMKRFSVKYTKLIQTIENCIFIVIFSSLIIISNTYVSQYKFLFLFIIITSTLQLGMNYGMTMAVISSVIILGIDLIFAPKLAVNLFFENDLILAGVFMLTAWPLGHYVRIEKENIEKKNLQLQKLNKELNQQDKQRRYMEEMLLKNEACYNLLIENYRDAIFVHRDGKLIFTNESYAKLLGFEQSEKLSDKRILDFTRDEDKQIVKEKFIEIYNEKNTISSFEEKVVKNNGEIVSVVNTSVYFLYEGKDTILSILHDITSEKQVEKLQKDVEKNIELLNETIEYNKLITEFFSNISHELKTPLNVIFAALQVMNIYNNNPGKEFENKRKKYITVMKQNCYRLLRLINNLLDMSRLDSGFLKLDLQNLDIVKVVEDITLSVAAYVESKDIRLIFDTEVEEKRMSFDPDKIERIILNLLSNAAKFTSAKGEIFVYIADKVEFIEISIRDTGTGIPQDKLEIIFDRFGQVDKTFRRDCEGSGIGLSLVKSFVEMHGGSIKVKSKLGQGSQFLVILPVKVLKEEDYEQVNDYEANIERINVEFSDIYADF